MPSTFTAETLYRLLLHTVAPTFADRRAADQMLFSLSAASGGCRNPELDMLIDEATELFGDRLQTYLHDLMHFWMEACANCYAKRMARFEKRPGPAWSSPTHSPTFPMVDSCTFGEWDLFGMGTATYLEKQARRLEFLAPLLVHGLAHPESTVSDACWNVLARHPRNAAAAFPAMWAIAREKGPWFGPDQPMRSLAAVVDAHPPALDTIVASFAASDSDNEINAASRVVMHLSSVPPRVVDAIEAARSRASSAERGAALFITLTRIAAYATNEQRRAWLADAVKLASSPQESLRAASAWAFVRLDDPIARESALRSLLDDADWWPRRDACAALAEWPSPSPVIVDAVARRLGDYDGYDGDPHATALQTLMSWKGASTAALPAIAAWLDRSEHESGDVRAETLVELLDAIGDAAHVLHPQIARFLSAREQGEESAAEESDDGADTEQQFNTAWEAVINNFSAGLQVPEEVSAQLKEHEGLRQEFRDALGGGDEDVVTSVVDVNAFAARLGIDANEDIPGTRSSAELAAEPDAEARLRVWVLAATGT
jgi:hypothetical protein